MLMLSDGAIEMNVANLFYVDVKFGLSL